ncbi:unnamed protein product [Symbiodinium sp. CCMP2592]|nr:unnamed protein product [Symbiodinium sp. CCMP2592]
MKLGKSRVSRLAVKVWKYQNFSPIEVLLQYCLVVAILKLITGIIFAILSLEVFLMGEMRTFLCHIFERRLKYKQGPSNFIRGSTRTKEGEVLAMSSLTSRRTVEACLQSPALDLISGLVVVVDVGLTCIDIDLRAAGVTAPTWAFLACQGCLAFYFLELLANALVYGRQVLRSFDWWVDISIVFASVTEIIFLLAGGGNVEEVRYFKLLRIARIMRLMRFIRKSPSLRELRKLMMMFASVIRTLAWSFLFCFIATTLWSMVAVELLNPIVQELAEEGAWSDCKDCRDAFSTVLQSNLTFLKTMLAGDSWGQIALPVIHRQPYTAAIFVGALISVMYGILNLVVAVIVDAAMEQREKDISTLAADLDYELQEDIKLLGQMFKKVDANGDGELSLSELIQGAEEVPEFQNRLRVMDIDAVDLEQLFRMLDEDQGGSISPDEFQIALSRWMRESKTANHFVKYMVRNLSTSQGQLAKQVRSIRKNLAKLTRAVESSALPSPSSPLEGKTSDESTPADGISFLASPDKAEREVEVSNPRPDL